MGAKARSGTSRRVSLLLRRAARGRRIAPARTRASSRCGLRLPLPAAPGLPSFLQCA
ncbi:hypothetical protein CLJ1_3180 [Pseudomonas paraeruginosa]|nr:hypothetical protein CLJ1_3180 [Pseudomonas aeruginosa]